MNNIAIKQIGSINASSRLKIHQPLEVRSRIFVRGLFWSNISFWPFSYRNFNNSYFSLFSYFNNSDRSYYIFKTNYFI